MKRPGRSLMAAALLGLAACSGGDDGDVRLGYVEADWRYIAAPQAGWIVDSPTGEGETVTAGEVVFRLDATAERAALEQAQAEKDAAGARARDAAQGARQPEIMALEAQRDEAQARLDEAQDQFERTAYLVEQGFASEAAGDKAQAQLKTAKAALEAAEQSVATARLAARPGLRAAAEAQTLSAEAAARRAAYHLEQREVTAALDGRVEEVFFHAGEYVTPGAPVLAVLPKDGLKVRFFVQEEALPQIALGKVVKVAADGLTDPVEAKVTHIATEAEYTPPVIYSRDARKKLVFMVEATAPADSALRPGLPVEVSW